MQKRISAVKARQNLGQIINEVSIREDEYVIERAGKPVAVVVSVDKYEMIQRIREEAWDLQRTIWEKMAGEDPDEMNALIDEAVHAVRKR